MLDTLQSHWGFTVMPFAAGSPSPACSARPPTRKPSPGCGG